MGSKITVGWWCALVLGTAGAGKSAHRVIESVSTVVVLLIMEIMVLEQGVCKNKCNMHQTHQLYETNISNISNKYQTNIKHVFESVGRVINGINGHCQGFSYPFFGDREWHCLRCADETCIAGFEAELSTSLTVVPWRTRVQGMKTRRFHRDFTEISHRHRIRGTIVVSNRNEKSIEKLQKSWRSRTSEHRKTIENHRISVCFSFFDVSKVSYIA